MSRRAYDHSEFDAADLAAGRRRSVSVCIPARNEARTVGSIVSAVRTRFTAAGGGVDLVDEIVVVDDRSTDGTGQAALKAGVRVERVVGPGGGKGEAMTLATQATTGDLLVFLDADVEPFPSHFVPGLLGPLLTEEDVMLVKASYVRTLNGVPGEGGRVNELVARPVISLLIPSCPRFSSPWPEKLQYRVPCSKR